MIQIHFKDNEKMELRDEMFEALMGSLAFIKSEIDICDGCDDDFYLIIGEDNGKNVAYEGSVEKL